MPCGRPCGQRRSPCAALALCPECSPRVRCHDLAGDPAGKGVRPALLSPFAPNVRPVFVATTLRETLRAKAFAPCSLPRPCGEKRCRSVKNAKGFAGLQPATLLRVSLLISHGFADTKAVFASLTHCFSCAYVIIIFACIIFRLRGYILSPRCRKIINIMDK